MVCAVLCVQIEGPCYAINYFVGVFCNVYIDVKYGYFRVKMRK